MSRLSPRLRPLLLGALLVLAGCASAGPMRAPETALPPAFEGATGPLVPAALDRWWLGFDDPQLTALIDNALARSSDAREAAARLAEARAVRRGALTAFDPQGDLAINGQGEQQQIIDAETITFPGAEGEGGTNPFAQGGLIITGNAGFDVSWELDLFGRRAAARREADATLLAARFDAEASRASIAANVADALFALRGVSARLAEVRETLRIRRALREIATERARRGLAAEAEVARIETELADTLAEETALAAEAQANTRALLVLTGDAVSPTAAFDAGALLPPVPPAPALVPGELLARRPDVRAAAARLAAAAGRLRLDELALFPRFSLQPGVGLSTTQGGAFDSTLLAWTLGAGLTAPILDRPRLIAQLRAQEARAEQAVIGYERAVQTAFSETDQALVRLAADRRRIAELEAGAAAANRSFTAAEELYRRGLTGTTELLDAEAAWRAARLALVAARVEGLRRAVQAYKAAGGGWSMGE